MAQPTTSPRCFVIQPFDGDKFDKRYADVFAPAIRAAGLEPYRVDQDPGVVVPIETIEKQITEASICFAEITLDNPNVWFELGFARAVRKPLCMVCSSERTTSFPFDVRHRSIIKYTTGAPSDFDKVRKEITERLTALQRKEQELETISALTPTIQTKGLSPHEMAVMTLLIGAFGESSGSTSWSLKQDMRKAGYTDAATALAVVRLKRSGLIEEKLIRDHDDRDYWAWTLSDTGTEWLLANEQLLELRRRQAPAPDPVGSEAQQFKGDDIPF